MAVLADLQTAYANIAAKLVAMTANPKPNYSLDGESYSWQQLFASYTAQLEKLKDAIQREEGPYELRSQAL